MANGDASFVILASGLKLVEGISASNIQKSTCENNKMNLVGLLRFHGNFFPHCHGILGHFQCGDLKASAFPTVTNQNIC